MDDDQRFTNKISSAGSFGESEFACDKILSQAGRLDTVPSPSSNSIFKFETSKANHLQVETEFDRLKNALNRVISFRLVRDLTFGPTLFDDPGWDILLDLASARLYDQSVTVSDACIASKVPQTTALRYIDRLQEAGLIERSNDRSDKRRILLQISELGFEKVKEVLYAA